MALEYIPFYLSYRKKLEKLSDQEVGRLVRALLKYSETGEVEELTGRESIAFDFIADDFERAKAAYAERCVKNRANIEKRYSRQIEDVPSNTIEYDCIPSNTNVYESYQTKDKTKVNILSHAREADFDLWWAVYPKKVGKEAARKAFTKVKASTDTLITAVEAQKRSEQWQRDNGRFIPNPATWLNQGRWEDELTSPHHEEDTAVPFAPAGMVKVMGEDGLTHWITAE